MKKLLALFLAVCALCCCLLVPVGAQTGENTISLRINSNIAGCTRADAEKLLEIRSGPVTYYNENGYSVFIANYAGGGEYAHMDAGRTYTLTYTLAAADGYTLPGTLPDGFVALDCGKGVSVLSCRIIELYDGHTQPASGAGQTVRALRITANVVVDGTTVQRIIGWLRDLFLKIRSWSLY